MSKDVFANHREVSAVKSGNKSVAAMPDVCHSPPPPPTTPTVGIPIPYPNFSKSSDTTDGTKSVKIGKKSVGIKNRSSYKTSHGNEPATPSLRKGIVTHTLKGKTYFASWSFDVRFEGKNAQRYMDTTMHNNS